jgi:hypothetical protein
MSWNAHLKKNKISPPIISPRKALPTQNPHPDYIEHLEVPHYESQNVYIKHHQRFAYHTQNATLSNAHLLFHARKRNTNSVNNLVVEDHGIGINIHEIHRFMKKTKFVGNFSFHEGKLQNTMVGRIFRHLHNKTRGVSINLLHKCTPDEILQRFNHIRTLKKLSYLGLDLDNQDFFDWVEKDYKKLVSDMNALKNLKGFHFSDHSQGMHENFLEVLLHFIRKQTKVEDLFLSLPEIERFHTSPKDTNPYLELCRVLNILPNLKAVSLVIDGSSVTNENVRQLGYVLSTKSMDICKLKINNPNISPKYEILNSIPNFRLELASNIVSLQADNSKHLSTLQFPVEINITENYWKGLANKDFTENLFESLSQVNKLEAFYWREETWKTHLGRKNVFPGLSYLLTNKCQDLKKLGLKFTSSEMISSVLKDLNSQLKSMSRLTYFGLDISQYNQADGCDDLLLELMSSLAELPALEELHFGIVGSHTSTCFQKSLFDRIAKIKHLKRLEIPHMKLSKASILYLFSKISKLHKLEGCVLKFAMPDEPQCKEDRRGVRKDEFLMRMADYIGCVTKLASLEIRFPFVISNNLIKNFEERLFYKNKKLNLKVNFDVLAFLMNI